MFILFTEVTYVNKSIFSFIVNCNNLALNKFYDSKNLNVKIGVMSMIVHEQNHHIQYWLT